MSDTLLDLRLNSIQKAQERARAAFFLAVIASTVIGLTSFNRTLSWEAAKPSYPFPATEENKAIYSEKLQTRMSRDNYTIPVLGVNVSGWDLGLIGPATLLAFVFYFLAASGSVRSQIADLNDELPDSQTDLARIYVSLKSQMIFDAAIPDYCERKGSSRWFAAGRVYRAFIYFPFAVSLSSVAAAAALLTPYDAYQHGLRMYQTLSRTQWVQVIVFDGVGLLLSGLIFVFTRSIVRNSVAVEHFARKLNRLRASAAESLRATLPSR